MKNANSIATYLFIASLVLFVALIPAVQGCAALDRFKPIITTAGHELLVELDALLTEYEKADIPIDATIDEWLAFELEQNARAAKIQNRLYHASLEAPADAVRPSRKRLRAVPTQSP